ncbi:MAG: hypothetical protein OJF50_004077 [Nitrospira sp.]|nr:hypothetical protein [Nitrospira sp.]
MQHSPTFTPLHLFMMDHGEQEHHIISYNSLSSIALSDDVIERARKFDVEWTSREVESCASVMHIQNRPIS